MFTLRIGRRRRPIWVIACIPVADLGGGLVCYYLTEKIISSYSASSKLLYLYTWHAPNDMNLFFMRDHLGRTTYNQSSTNLLEQRRANGEFARRPFANLYDLRGIARGRNE